MNAEVVRNLLSAALDKALTAQAPAARGYVRRERAQDPYRSPAEHIALAESRFVAAVTTLGAAAGGAAAVPGIGTVAGAATNLAEVGAFVEANVFFVLVVAEVHGSLPDDPARLRALVLAALLGDASELLTRGAGRFGRHWGREIANGIPQEVIEAANTILGRRFVSRWGTRQGMLVLGRELPVLFGAAVGGVGNRVLARKVVSSVGSAFGPPPSRFTGLPSAG
jgi:hypothetical protein